jgi:RNA polymerase sigma-B factor
VKDRTSDWDEAEALVAKYLKTGEQHLLDEILRVHTPLVERVARRYAGLEMFEDLVQVGFIGLLNALTMFEPEKGVKFSTYATHLVVGAMKHHLRDRSRIIREPAWLQEARHRVRKAHAALVQELGREPNDDELIAKAEITQDTLAEIRTTEELFKVASINATYDDDDEEAETPGFSDEGRTQLTMEERLVLEEVMSGLRDLEREVLYLFHVEALNQTEIAVRLGISPNYVGHILRQSTNKLRKVLEEQEEADRKIRLEVGNAPTEVMDESIGCYREDYLMRRLDEEVHRASCVGSAVGFVRVHFEGLDALARFYGPSVVENFLQNAADFLRDGVRRLDVVGRVGQTGFGIIFPGTGEQVRVAHDRIRAKVQGWLERNAGASQIGVSMGVAYYPECGRSGRTLFAAARLVRVADRRAA